MNRIAARSYIIFILVLSLVAGMAFFATEYVIESPEWVLETGSPHIYDEQGIHFQCGMVVERDNLILLDLRDGRQYTGAELLRKSTLHWLGDRYGNIAAPTIDYYADKIADFDRINGLYHYGETGGVVKLTLSGKVQRAALEALGEHKGTVAVYNYKTGEILCAVSTPTYDPDNVPDIAGDTTGVYEGAYLNRFTQSVYTPGSIFKIVTLAAALETIEDIQQRSFQCTGSVTIEPDSITCEHTHGVQDLKSAFSNSCNCVFAQIAMELGSETMDRYAAAFGITQSITFDGITTAAGNYEAGSDAINIGWSGVGQYNDQINPCAYLTFLGAIANGGQGVNPYIVEGISVGRDSAYKAQTQQRDRILSEETAQVLQSYLRNNVMFRYGDYNFPGLTVCAKTGTAEVGGDQKPNAMFTGFVTDEEYPLAFIICVENAGYGGTVCIPMASAVLEACKDALDS